MASPESPSRMEVEDLTTLELGVHSTRRMRTRIAAMQPFAKVSPIVQQYLMESENSHIERLGLNEQIAIEDPDFALDYIYVLHGAVEVTLQLQATHQIQDEGTSVRALSPG